MTPEEFQAAMAGIVSAEFIDKEMAHIDADALMGRMLTELGYGAGVALYEEFDKWYA